MGRAVTAGPPAAVAATHHTATPTTSVAVWHRLDLRDGGDAVAALIGILRPRAVVNAAYVQGGDHLEPVTARAPGAMAVAAREIGARFVHVSTDVVFDGTTDRPYTEDDTPSPVHDYGRAKLESERRVAAAHPDAVIVRTSLLYGDRNDPGPQVRLATEPDITFFDDEYRNPLACDSLAAACLELADRPDIAGVLHVAGADTVDRYTFARLVAPMVDVDPTTLHSGPSPAGSTRPRHCPLDSSRARALLRTDLPGVTTLRP